MWLILWEMEKQRKENIKPYELSGRKRNSVFGEKKSYFSYFQQREKAFDENSRHSDHKMYSFFLPWCLPKTECVDWPPKEAWQLQAEHTGVHTVPLAKSHGDF